MTIMDESGFSAGADVQVEEADVAAETTLAVWEQRQVDYGKWDAVRSLATADQVRALAAREIDRLSERLAAVTADNERLRAERDALADAVKALSPPPPPVAHGSRERVDNPFARRHSGQAPDKGAPR